MKNLIKILSVMALFAIVQSCDVLSETEPSTSLPQEAVLTSEDGVTGLRANLYSRWHSFTPTTNYMLGPSALADELANTLQATRFLGYVEFGRTVESGSGIGNWGYYYGIINLSNVLINSIAEGVLPPETLDQYRGEAFFFRAFSTHLLARAYSYEPGANPATGSGVGWDLGVVLRTTPTLTPEEATYKARATVSQVYAQIISDLENSISLLEGNDAGSTFYITEAAAHALLARVHLYARNYQEADEHATLAISTTSATLVQPSGVASMFDETAGVNPGAIFILDINPDTETIGVNDALSAYTSQEWSALAPTQKVLDLYSNEDPRLAWYAPCFDEIGGEAVDGCPASHPAIPTAGPDQGLEIQKWSAEQGNYADDIPYFRIAEMKFIQAEARLLGGLGNALAPLNEMRAARNMEPYTGGDIMEAILNGRIREFVAEGHRYWDLKRLGMEIPKTPAQNVEPIPYFEHIIIDELPNNQIAQSENNAPADSVLVQNPEY